MRSSVLFVLTALSCFGMTARAFEVHQVLRGERLVDAGTNIRPVQPIDEASWIGLSGDVPPPPPLEENAAGSDPIGGLGSGGVVELCLTFPLFHSSTHIATGKMPVVPVVRVIMGRESASKA